MEEQNIFNKSKIIDENGVISKSFFQKVFLFFGIEMLFASGLTLLFSGLILKYFDETYESSLTFLVLLLVALILTIVLGIINTRLVYKNFIAGVINSSLYIVSLSFLLGFVSVSVNDQYLVGIALGASSLIFILMCLCGFIYKSKLAWLYSILTGLLIGIIIILLANLFLVPLLLVNQTPEYISSYKTLLYIAEFALLAYACLIVIIDIVRIKKVGANLINSSEDSINKLSLIFSIQLFSDFVYLFLRILSLIIRIKGDN